MTCRPWSLLAVLAASAALAILALPHRALDAAPRSRYRVRMQEWLRERLAELEAAGLLRDPADADARQELTKAAGSRLLDACSNDYLGLAATRVSRETLEKLGSLRVGAGASRLVQGT